jgi:hypothetical protein
MLSGIFYDDTVPEGIGTEGSLSEDSRLIRWKMENRG